MLVVEVCDTMLKMIYIVGIRDAPKITAVFLSMWSPHMPSIVQPPKGADNCVNSKLLCRNCQTSREDSYTQMLSGQKRCIMPKFWRGYWFTGWEKLELYLFPVTLYSLSVTSDFRGPLAFWGILPTLLLMWLMKSCLCWLHRRSNHILSCCIKYTNI